MKKEKQEKLNTEEKEISQNLEEQGLIKINPENPEEARLTPKGVDEVLRWKEKNKEMDFLLFIFRETGERLNKISKEGYQSAK